MAFAPVATLALSLATTAFTAIQEKKVAKTNKKIAQRRKKVALRDFDLQSRSILGDQIASAGSSGIGISSFESIFNSQAIENSRKRKDLAFEKSIAIEQFDREADSALIGGAFEAGTSLLDFDTQRQKRKRNPLQI